MKEIEVFQVAVKKDLKNIYLSVRKAKRLFQGIVKKIMQNKEH